MNKTHIIKLNESRRKEGGWNCSVCNNNFTSKAIMYKHLKQIHPEKSRPRKPWRCSYCGTILNTRATLFEHYKECEEKKKLLTDSKGRVISEEVIKGRKKQGKSLSKRYKEGLIRPFASYSKNWTPEMRALQAEKMQNYRKKIGTLSPANVSKRASEFIDVLNIKNNWNMEHGLNGKEKQIGPYFVDGYDEEKNIVFEYDEPRHHKTKERDLARQQYIIENLDCEFWRYDEKTDLLYRVN
jgi:hypothetical protein